MDSILIRTQIESDTICIPALKAMIGKNVEIVVHEMPESVSGIQSAAKDFTPLAEIAGRISIDPDAYKDMREADML
jgi:hypothetical protein